MDQVLEPIVFPLFNTLDSSYMFMEDGSKVYKGNACLPKLNHGIRTFDWSPSLPDLNIIEKVWCWIKEELKKLPYISKNKEYLIREI